MASRILPQRTAQTGRRPYGPYLRSAPNATGLDNLDALPDCAFLGVRHRNQHAVGKVTAHHERRVGVGFEVPLT